jgi:hypothetical protein
MTKKPLVSKATVGLFLKASPRFNKPMKDIFSDKDLIKLGTHAFEQKFLITNGYKVINRHRYGGASFVLAQKSKIRLMFLLHIYYQDKIVIDEMKRTKKDTKDLYKLLLERAQIQGALAAIAKIDLDDNLDRLTERHPAVKQSVLGTNKGILYVSQPIAKVKYRTPYDNQ